MTPEQAQELLDKATPGPWWVETESPCECCTYVAAPAAAVCTPDMEDAPLIAAAPELAEIVAGLRYEYAVQLKHGDGWITSRHHTPTVEVAKEVAARYKRSETRIVRHLATDWEVVE